MKNNNFNWEDIKQGDVILMSFLPGTNSDAERDLFLVQINNLNFRAKTFSGKNTVRLFYRLNEDDNPIKESIKLETRDSFYCWDMKDNVILKIFR